MELGIELLGMGRSSCVMLFVVCVQNDTSILVADKVEKYLDPSKKKLDHSRDQLSVPSHVGSNVGQK